MDGLEYEKYCMSFLKKHGFKNIQCTKASGDQGIDILATKHRKKYGFQCKYYSSSVGNDAVQQAYSGAAYYDCDVACVITNSTFTKGAIALAKETDVLLYEQIDAKSNYFWKVLIAFTSLLLCFASYLFVLELKQPQYTDMHVLTCICMILCCTFSYFVHMSVICTFLACFLSFCCIFLYFIFYAFSTFSYFILFLLGYICIYTTTKIFSYHKKQKEIQHALDLEHQKEIFIREGKQLASFLQEEVQYHITYIDGKEEDAEILYQFRSTKDISNEFALLAYTLQQISIFHEQPKQYTFESIDTHNFKVHIKTISCKR